MKVPFVRPLVQSLLLQGMLFVPCHETLAEAHINFRLQKPAQVSMAVYDPAGSMVREISRAVPYGTGEHKVGWDGLDREGQPVPPGAYTWKLLSSQGLETEYVMSLGTSVGNEHWAGVHGGPSAVTVHDNRMMMATVGSEAAMGLAAADLDGSFAWSEHSLGGWGVPLDAAVVRDKLWVIYGNSGITHAAAVKDGKNLKTEFQTLIPFKSIDLSQTTPAIYNAPTGFGWQSVDGITAHSSKDGEGKFSGGGHRITTTDPKSTVSFIIDMPVSLSETRTTPYNVHLHFGGDTNPAASPNIAVQIEGKTRGTFIQKNHSPSGGIVAISASSTDGKLELVFASTDKTLPLDFILRGIEITASANSMDASEDQMIVTAAGASTLLWVDPVKEPTSDLPDYAVLTGLENMRHHHWAFNGGSGGLQTAIPGAFAEHGYFLFQFSKAEFSVELTDGKPHRMALYFNQDLSELLREKPYKRVLTVELIDQASGKVLDSHELSDMQEGKWLVWNIRDKVTVRLTAPPHGAAFINGIFFGPPSAVIPEGTAAEFEGLDTTTGGYWQGQYGQDGFLISGLKNKFVDSAEVPDIQDAEIAPDGTIVAISGNHLVTLSRLNKTPNIRASGLESPMLLAVDQGNGDVWVYQAGDSQQIVRFDRDFNQIATYGRRGGRRDGRYIPTDFKGVADIASDNRGGFLVAEWMSAPRRVAYFNRAGDVQQEWYGGQMFYQSPGIDSDDPSTVWLNSQFGWLFEMKVDYGQKTYKIISTWNMKEQLDPLLFQHPKGFWIWTQPLTIQGERYLASEQATGLILKPDYENGRLIPVAAASVLQETLGVYASIPDDHPWKKAFQAFGRANTKGYDARVLRNFGYVDRNGDLQMQPEEFILDTNQPLLYSDSGYGSFIDADMTAWRWGHDWGKPLWYRLPASEKLENGLPVWNYANKVAGPTLDRVRGLHLLPSDDGNLFQVELHENDGFGRWWHQTTWEGHGFGWPATMVNQNLLTKRDRDGNLIWQASGAHSGSPHSPKGNVDLGWRIAGKVDDVIGLQSQTRQPCEFFSSDGLYIGGVLDKRADDGLPPNVYAWWRVDHDSDGTPDNMSILRYDLGQSGIIARAPDGGVLFFGSGRNNLVVYRINGFDDITNQTGTVNIKHPSSGAVETGTGLKAHYFANTALEGEPVTERIDGDIWFGFAFKAGKEQNQQIPWPETEITAEPFSVRWTGMLEPRFTEETVIGFYDRHSGVRVWIDDNLVIDDWEDNGKKEWSDPIPMIAGKKLPIRIEWRQIKPQNQEAHLVWESLSQPIEHIPGEYLYPDANHNKRK